MIQFDSVIKSYDQTHVLKDINLCIEDKEFVVIVGPSGSGKTTLLKLINRLILPDNGRIEIDNQDISQTNLRELRLNMGYVLQKIALFPNLTVGENIQLIPEMKGIPKDEIEIKTKALLETVGLPSTQYINRYPNELSGGEQQRVGILRAIIGDPKILLMDEPFSALDVITRKQLQKLIRKLHVQFGMTTVFVTHDIDEALKLADRLVMLNHGEIEMAGTPTEVMNQSDNDFVHELIGGTI